MEFKETISEEAFYRRVYKKSNSQDSMTQVKVAVSTMRYYCRDVFYEDEKIVLSKLKQQDSIDALFNFLNEFIDWMENDHPGILWKRHFRQKIGTVFKGKSAATIVCYVSMLQKYLKLCYGIGVDLDDWKTDLALSLKEKNDPEPMTPRELQTILDVIYHSAQKTKGVCN